MPAIEGPWCSRILQATGPLTAAPTAIDVLRQMAGVRLGAAPDAAWYVALARALKAAYAQRLVSLGDAEGPAAESCTTHLSVCDEEGSMVAMTTTLLSSMGSRVVLPGTGILMNNGVMWFDPRPGRPNSIAPGKRPLTNMFPVILRDGERPMDGGGRVRRAAHHGGSAAADRFRRRIRHDAGGGGASAAYRRIRSPQGDRRLSAGSGYPAGIAG